MHQLLVPVVDVVLRLVSFDVKLLSFIEGGSIKNNNSLLSFIYKTIRFMRDRQDLALYRI